MAVCILPFIGIIGGLVAVYCASSRSGRYGSGCITVVRAHRIPGRAASVRPPLDLADVDALEHHFIERAQVQQFIHRGDHLVDRKIDFFFGGVTPESKADRAVCDFVTQA